ncbi:hypothetical protein BDN70DRAFT_917930 [Pholiota conissans]|uniref:Uncharacterized protein n=1 Tax=Pholiota conissans TaxID=109636 RepID=A0A9P5ZCN2_9AGAR|nr:hypothetical protein BDN70DRAFT_917930 [Pholiota conissans]
MSLPALPPVSAEPKAITPPSADSSPSPSTVEASPLKPVKTIVRGHKRRRLRAILRGIGSVLTDVLTALWICLIYGIPGLLLIVLVIIPMFALSFALAAANGAVMLLAGNGILRAAHHAHYTPSNAIAAEIGAVGGVLSGLIFGFLAQCLPTDEDGRLWWPFSMAGSVIVGTLSGAIGTAILNKHNVDLKGIDLLHATRAGALGGTILGPGQIVAVPLIFAALMILLSPLLIAMKMGLRWVYVRSSESWSDRGTYRASYCYSYGTCGDDPEIEEELADVRRHEREMNRNMGF